MLPAGQKQAKMSRTDVKRFRDNMSRLMRGERTPQESAFAQRCAQNYEVIVANNGGKDPFFG